MTFVELEQIRIKYKNKSLLAFGIAICIVLATLLVLCINKLYDIIPAAFIFTFLVGVVTKAIITSGSAKLYTKAYKDYFIKRSLEKIFTDLKYEPDRGISEKVIEDTGMMYMGDRYSSNDYISGKYKNINFIQSDVHIEEEHTTTDSDGNTRTYYVTVFLGRWMIFDFNKEFKANVQVCEKGFENNITRSKIKYEKVEMESDAFNKKFNIYAQNAHDAFYILTPSLMEKIDNLEKRNKGKILLCFINNQLHVGLYDGKDSFEPSSCFKEINEEEELKRASVDIEQITMFVDELQLDNTLFRREV